MVTPSRSSNNVFPFPQAAVAQFDVANCNVASVTNNITNSVTECDLKSSRKKKSITRKDDFY